MPVTMPPPIEQEKEKAVINGGPSAEHEAIAQCRRTNVVSQFMVCQTEPAGHSPPGRHIWRDTITRRFRD